MALSEQTFWLIERSDLAPYPLYMRHTARGHAWTPDHDEAVRFATAEEASAECCGGDANGPLRVAEHKWLGSALLDAARAEQKEDAEPMKMLVDGDWLPRKVATDPDTDTEAGSTHPPRAEQPLDRKVDELATLVRMLAQHVPDAKQIKGRALDYLARHSLNGSPLRAEQPVVSREAVARIIDPEAWEEYLLEDGRADEEVASIFQDAYETSLTKADAILALASPGGEQEAVNSKLVEKLKRLRQIRYDVPVVGGEVEKCIPRHLLEEVIAALASPVRGAGEEEQ